MLHKPHFKHPGATNVAGVSNNMSSGYQTWKEMFLLENFCKSVFFKLINNFTCFNVWASLVAQIVKNLYAMQETQVWCLGLEDPLEKGMATHSSNLVYSISWTEKPGGLHTVHGVTPFYGVRRLSD